MGYRGWVPQRAGSVTLLESLIRDKMYGHPLPWTIDYDWCVEVIDSNGRIVTKLMHRDMAMELINMAERISAEDAAFRAEFEGMVDAAEAGDQEGQRA